MHTTNGLRPIAGWYIAAFFAFFQFFIQTIGSVLGSEWQTSFALDTIGLGNLSAIFFWAYVLMQIPVGILYDRYSYRNILMCACFVLASGCFLFATTHVYSVALLARFLMGIGAACGFVGLLKVTTLCFPANRFAMMIGVSEGIAMMGVTASIMLMAVLLPYYSWRVMINSCGMIASLLLCFVFFFTKAEPAPEKTPISCGIILQQLRIIIFSRQFILAGTYGFFLFALISVFTSLWGVTFIAHTTALDRQTAASIVATVLVGVAIGSPLNGYFTKQMQKHKPIMIAFGAISAFIMSALIFYPYFSKLELFLFYFLAGFFSAVYLQAFPVIRDAVNPQYQATALAVANMFIVLSGPILQSVIGFLLQSHFFHLAVNNDQTYRFSLGILPIGMFIAVIVSFFIKEPI